MTATRRDTERTAGPANQPVLRSAYQRSVAAYWNNEATRSTSGWVKSTGSTTTTTASATTTRPCSRARPAPATMRSSPRCTGWRPRRPTCCSTTSVMSSPADWLLDGGSGRGGTSFMAHQRFGCQVDGVTHLGGSGRVRRRPGPPAGCGRPGAVPFPQHARHRVRGGIPARDLDQRDHDVRRPAPALQRVRPAASLRRPLCVHHRLLQRRHRRPLQGGQPDRPALHLRYPPAAASTSGPWRPAISSRST